MATITPKKLCQGALTTSSVAALYTVPASTITFLKDIDVANTTAAPVSLTINLVPSGGSVATSNQLVPVLPIAGNSMWQWTGTQILNVGDTIHANGSAVGLTINSSGAERL
jgi:hypothetical protein